MKIHLENGSFARVGLLAGHKLVIGHIIINLQEIVSQSFNTYN